MSNLNPSSTKNTFDSQLFVNCTFDMDYLEITKNESLRKYEENVYLLGKIFSVTTNKNKSENEMIIDENIDEKMNENEYLIEEEINSLFENKFHNNNYSENILEEETIKINTIVEKIKASGNIPEEKLKILTDQIFNSLQDLAEHENILNNNKNNFRESTSKFNELNQKLRVIKSEENSAFFNDILKTADEMGILSETHKQYDNFLKEKKKYNCELPFDPSSNIIIMPL